MDSMSNNFFNCSHIISYLNMHMYIFITKAFIQGFCPVEAWGKLTPWDPAPKENPPI